MVNAVGLEKLGNGHYSDNQEKNEANERSNKSTTTSVAIAFKFVTNLIPSCM